jgi:hypothetical protein
MHGSFGDYAWKNDGIVAKKWKIGGPPNATRLVFAEPSGYARTPTGSPDGVVVHVGEQLAGAAQHWISSAIRRTLCRRLLTSMSITPKHPDYCDAARSPRPSRAGRGRIKTGNRCSNLLDPSRLLPRLSFFKECITDLGRRIATTGGQTPSCNLLGATPSPCLLAS